MIKGEELEFWGIGERREGVSRKKDTQKVEDTDSDRGLPIGRHTYVLVQTRRCVNKRGMQLLLVYVCTPIMQVHCRHGVADKKLQGPVAPFDFVSTVSQPHMAA